MKSETPNSRQIQKLAKETEWRLALLRPPLTQTTRTQGQAIAMEPAIFSQFELTDQNLTRFGEPLTKITTASQWFIAQFPAQARIYGAPFLENRTSTLEGLSTSSPVLPNCSFMASILGQDDAFPNAVIYWAGDGQFYYYDPVDQHYHACPDAKLGDLMRGYFCRCSLAVQREANVYHLSPPGFWLRLVRFYCRG